MFSRRNLLLGASASTGWLAFSGVELFAASDFWNKKDPGEWSEQEIETLKTKSPWARKIHGEGGFGGRGAGGGRGSSMDSSGSRGTFGGMSGADSNGISAGGGGGRRGGGGAGDMGAAPSAPQGPEVVIRWESATPMLAATKFQLPPALADHYAISITGLPPQLLTMVLNGRGGRGGGRGRDGAENGAPPPDAEAQPAADPAEEAKARQDRLLHAATLSAKNKDPQTADTVLQTADKRTIIFGFLKANMPLAATDKDLEFDLKFGPTMFKAKFEPKEMMFKGALTV